MEIILGSIMFWRRKGKPNKIHSVELAPTSSKFEAAFKMLSEDAPTQNEFICLFQTEAYQEDRQALRRFQENYENSTLTDYSRWLNGSTHYHVFHRMVENFLAHKLNAPLTTSEALSISSRSINSENFKPPKQLAEGESFEAQWDTETDLSQLHRSMMDTLRISSTPRP